MFIDWSKIQKVAEHWGDKMPMLVMEEAGELIQAISKVERKEDKYLENEELRNSLVGEIRDMYISLQCLMHHYGICTPEINEAIDEKLNRRYD